MAVNFNASTPAAISGTTNAVFQTDGAGNISCYVPTSASVATIVNLTAQTAAITTTTLYAVTVSGLYRVSYYSKITTAGGVSSVLGGTTRFRVGYTDPTDSTTPTATIADELTNTLNANTTTTIDAGSCVIAAAASSNITYAYDYTSAGSAMAYKLTILVEAL